ncbi:glycosyltransferase family 2 protein [Bacillus sp. DJP31]|uniref:glycosyltransferase family 2 protein n=1 Tax=Bacillus sp. DJP31 TaxID=3409789 RepID=UPI003BB4B595
MISVLIPTYNRLNKLAELMESLHRQTYQNFEILIVNDCGISVKKVVDLYSHLQISVRNLAENSKQVHARNVGLAQAKGDYILLCDDDDLLLPDHLERSLTALDGYDLVYSDVEIVGFSVVKGTRMPMNRLLFAYEHDLEAMKKFSTFVSSGCLYRKSIHDTIGDFDVNVHNYWDWDFFLRVSIQFRVKRLPRASVLYEFSALETNESKHLDGKRNAYLSRFCEKHGLGELPQENFFTLLERPEMVKRKASSEVLWDGQPFVSRLVM